MIRLDRVGKTYPDGSVAVGELSLDIPRDEICILVGPSGCGKTTTLQMINRLVEPTSGRIFLDGNDVTDADPVELRRHMGYVIQQTGLFPHQTIATNIGTVPRLLGWKKERISARVDELLELVGLPPDVYRGRYPSQVSGGQRQRVGVARALAADPAVILMDEPFGAIDPVTRLRLQDEFLRLHGRCARRSCSSPTTSRKPSRWATGSPSSTWAASSSSSTLRRTSSGTRPPTWSPTSSGPTAR